MTVWKNCRTIIEGNWSENGCRGMWRIHLLA